MPMTITPGWSIDGDWDPEVTFDYEVVPYFKRLSDASGHEVGFLGDLDVYDVTRFEPGDIPRFRSVLESLLKWIDRQHGALRPAPPKLLRKDDGFYVDPDGDADLSDLVSALVRVFRAAEERGEPVLAIGD